ncbi:MAG: ATP-binding cassette domain-containing protein [Actinomycetota bacterium]|nr:ATP-binding cassette domain-containing protein [Actinomycetota bacterium]
MAVARVERLTFTYPQAAQAALEDVSLVIEPGEVVALLGPSGSGKSTLLRTLAGLVPHFHGGRFSGRVVVDEHDTRRCRPADLAGTVATLFQDPEDQVVFTLVDNEVAFGLENIGTPPAEIAGRARAALADVGAEHLAERRIPELSGGELQRVCLAATLALEPRLLLLDEPTSQLDPAGAEALLELACRLARDRGTAVLVSEQRPVRPLELCDRVVFLQGGRIVLDEPRDEAIAWLEREKPLFAGSDYGHPNGRAAETVCSVEAASFAYAPGLLVLQNTNLELRRGEVVALVGPNGSGKTTLAKVAAGLLEPQEGRVERRGRACYLTQDPGRYLLRERVDDEVAVAVGGDLERARAALASVGLVGLEARHPRDLSSGERERLALAAVLVAEPALLVLDEPTRGVDPERKAELAELLHRQAATRATLVATHDLAFAAAIADRTISLAPELEAAYAQGA